MRAKIGRVIGNMKFCPHCHMFKNINTEYSKSKANKDGVQAWCKTCMQNKFNPRKYKDRMDRFWKTVQTKTVKNGDCLDWTGAFHRTGYPMMSWYGKANKNLKRMIYKFSIGELLHNEYVVMKCDNLKCIRQSHMQKLNQEEYKLRVSNRMNKRFGSKLKSMNKGENNHFSKITSNEVMKIRELYENGDSVLSIADRFGLSKGYVYEIVKKRAWKHIP